MRKKSVVTEDPSFSDVVDTMPAFDTGLEDRESYTELVNEDVLVSRCDKPMARSKRLLGRCLHNCTACYCYIHRNGDTEEHTPVRILQDNFS